jgi:hypothetical protein
MQCWVSQEMVFGDEQAETHLREAWEHESGKDEMNVVLQGTYTNTHTHTRTIPHAHTNTQTHRETGHHMNKTHTDTHMQKPDHTRLPTYTHTHINTHKNTRAYTREGSPNGGLIWSTGGRRMLTAPDWELVGA